MPVNAIGKRKAGVRREVIARRNAMDAALRQEKSDAICKIVCEEIEGSVVANGGKAPLVALFSSFGSEVSLAGLERALAGRGYRVCYPGMVRVDGSERPKMMFFEVGYDLVASKEAPFLSKPSRSFELEEIRSCGAKPVEPADIDFAVIPLVAFDEDGERLGYGGGNYDEFLQGLRPGVPAVGVAYEEQRVEHVPCEPHDLPLGHIVSA